jgi:hypothetical protein
MNDDSTNLTYCVKCKKKTQSVDIILTKSLNNRNMLKGVCFVCGKNKSSFIGSLNQPVVPTALTDDASITTGQGFSLNNLINNLPIELHQYAAVGEDVPGGSFNNLQKYSFCGPGTKYEQRLREGYRGINALDNACMYHDKFYNEFTDTPSRNMSDRALASKADYISENSSNPIERKDAKFISGIMKAKATLGFGLGMPRKKPTDSKNLKRRRGMRH